MNKKEVSPGHASNPDESETIEFEAPSPSQTSAPTPIKAFNTKGGLAGFDRDNEEPMIRGLLDSRAPQQQATQTPKRSQIYIFWVLLASALMGIAGLIRGIESATPLPAKFSLSLCYLVLSTICIIYYKCRMGADFHFPWEFKGPGGTYAFNKAQFAAIVGGGLSEFATSIAVIMSFNAAQKANINQGIGSSIMTFNAAIVTLLSYCLMKEVVSVVQIMGIVVVVAAVALISVFGPEKDAAAVAQAQTQDSAGAMFLVVMWGIIGAIFLSFELMCNKWLMFARGVNGDISGVFFLLVEGTVGTICLIVTTTQGSGLNDMTGESFAMMMIAGVLAFSALILLNYSISIGLAGVAISLFNTNPALHVVLSSIFLKQEISSLQIVGVLLSLFGACLLSVGDMILEKLCGKKQVAPTVATALTEKASVNLTY